MLVQYIISMIMFFFLPVCPCTQCYIQYDFTNKLYSHRFVIYWSEHLCSHLRSRTSYVNRTDKNRLLEQVGFILFTTGSYQTAQWTSCKNRNAWIPYKTLV